MTWIKVRRLGLKHDKQEGVTTMKPKLAAKMEQHSKYPWWAALVAALVLLLASMAAAAVLGWI